ncbi:TPA: hypothetical protein ACGW44_005461 [Bacillus toyonensis]
MTNAHQNEKENLLVAMKTTKNKRMYERDQTIYFYVKGYSYKRNYEQVILFRCFINMIFFQ